MKRGFWITLTLIFLGAFVAPIFIDQITDMYYRVAYGFRNAGGTLDRTATERAKANLYRSHGSFSSGDIAFSYSSWHDSENDFYYYQ